MNAAIESALLRDAVRVVAGEQPDDFQFSDFWTDLCLGFGVVAAVAHDEGIEVLHRSRSNAAAARSQVLDAGDLYPHWIEFIVAADLSGTYYAPDYIDI